MAEIPGNEPRKHRTLAEREAAARARVEKPQVDFNKVPPSQWAIHDRLQEWARWTHSRTNDTAAPMFRLHRSDGWSQREYGTETVVPVDMDAALRTAKGVARLPEKHRLAVNWCYLSGKGAAHKARELAVSLQGLADLIRDGRQMLINWEV